MVSQGFESLENYATNPKPIEYIDASSMALIFKALEEQAPKLCAYNALRAFAGMRTAHADRFKWEQVVTGEKALRTIQQGKAFNDFVQGYPSNLWKWLAKYRSECLSGSNHSRLTSKVIKSIGIEPPKNGFRHSFATFHVALYKNASKTAYLMGHKGGESTLHQFYRGVAKPAEARAYFGINPT